MAVCPHSSYITLPAWQVIKLMRGVVVLIESCCAHDATQPKTNAMIIWTNRFIIEHVTILHHDREDDIAMPMHYALCRR